MQVSNKVCMLCNVWNCRVRHHDDEQVVDAPCTEHESSVQLLARARDSVTYAASL